MTFVHRIVYEASQGLFLIQVFYQKVNDCVETWTRDSIKSIDRVAMHPIISGDTLPLGVSSLYEVLDTLKVGPDIVTMTDQDPEEMRDQVIKLFMASGLFTN